MRLRRMNLTTRFWIGCRNIRQETRTLAISISLSDKNVRLTPSHDLNLLIHQLLIVLVEAGEFERIGQHGFALLDTGDHVGAAEPVGLGEISIGPLRRMVGMRMVETDDVLFALATFPLN